MSEAPTGESPAREATPERLISLDELESRLTRLEQLERRDQLECGAVAMVCPHAGAGTDTASAQSRTAVVFSDEPCETCGGRHEWSAVRATPTRTTSREPSA